MLRPRAGIVLVFSLVMFLPLATPAVAECGSGLAYDPSSLTPAHESNAASTPFIRIAFNDDGLHCGVDHASLTLQDLNTLSGESPIPVTIENTASGYALSSQITQALAPSHWQVVARITEVGGAESTVAWNFFAVSDCGSSLAYDPASLTPPHESDASSTPFIRIAFNDAGEHCGLTRATLTLQDLTTLSGERGIPFTIENTPNGYALSSQITTPLAHSHWQVVARVTEVGGAEDTVAWNFYDPGSCGTTLVHDATTMTPFHESWAATQSPAPSVTFVDNGEHCGLDSSSLTLQRLDVPDSPHAVPFTVQQVGAGYVVSAVPRTLAFGHWQAVARVHESGSGASDVFAWNFHVGCGDSLVADVQALVPVHESANGLTKLTLTGAFVDNGLRCGVGDASMTLARLDPRPTPAVPLPRVTSSVTSSGYSVSTTLPAPLPPGHYQVVARMTEAGSGADGVVAWNFFVHA